MVLTEVTFSGAGLGQGINKTLAEPHSGGIKGFHVCPILIDIIGAGGK